MPGFCKKCGSGYDEQARCAHCGSPVGLERSSLSSIPLDSPTIDDGQDGPSFVRRLALGIITVTGCYFGLTHLISGLSLAFSGANALSVEGSLGLLVAAILAGTTAAGTINRRAELTGVLLGLAAAGGFVGLETFEGRLPLEVWWIGVAVLLGMVGAVGGLAGRLMVPPAPDLPQLGQFDSRKMEVAHKPRVRVVWWRIAVSLPLVVLGTVYVDLIHHALSRALSGNGGTLISGKMIAWQMSLIVAVLGGVTAGANTRAGLKQGLIAGFLAAAAVFIALTRSNASASLLLEFWFDQLNVGEAGPELFAALGGSVWCAVAVGGWFGSHLLPSRR